MSLDLNTVLKDWPHEPGMIKVRKVTGLDGRDKLQLRIDLGVLQMEMTGRPDGLRPHGCDSLLSYHQNRAQVAEASGNDYELSPEDCSELQQEGIQYYHRYVSLFQLSDYAGVIRDTQRNLDLFGPPRRMLLITASPLREGGVVRRRGARCGHRSSRARDGTSAPN